MKLIDQPNLSDVEKWALGNREYYLRTKRQRRLVRSLAEHIRHGGEVEFWVDPRRRHLTQQDIDYIVVEFNERIEDAVTGYGRAIEVLSGVEPKQTLKEVK